MRADNANPNAKLTPCYTHTDSDSYSDCYDTAIPDPYAELDSSSNAYANSDCLAYSYAQGYTKGSANSAPSANTAVSNKLRKN